jgi:hypothetical protein
VLASASSPVPPPILLAGFEGEIDGVVKESKPTSAPLPVALLVKGDKFRIDPPEQLARRSASPLGSPTFMVVDSGAKKLYVVFEPRKQAFFIDLSKAPEMLKSMAPPPGPGRDAKGQPAATKVNKTGQFDTVAGFRCENWTFTSDHQDATVCVANEGATWFSLPLTGLPADQAWMGELLDGQHFPLRAVTYEKDGKTEATRVEVTKIEKKTLTDDQFQVPPGFAMVDLAQMIQGVAGMASGMHALPQPPAKKP